MNWMTNKPHTAWVLEIFWMVSPKASDFVEGNSTSKTLTKFDDHQNLTLSGTYKFLEWSHRKCQIFLREILCDDDQTSPSPFANFGNFLEGLTESVRLFLTVNIFIVNGSISLVWLTWEASCFANFFALFI